MNDKVHIVCLDAPSPASYGGAIDMYFKIVSLSSIGKKIILHYFNYKKNRNARGLEPYCSEIHAYERKTFLSSPSSLPYIVRSRINKDLVYRINQDNYPVILEGIHCTGILPYLEDSKRIVVRLHNEESAYYKNLSASEHNIFKRAYYELESSLLKKYYENLDRDTRFAAISMADITIMKELYQFEDIHFIPSFIPWQNVHSMEGRGDYCLYHGNLSVAENEAAVYWLIENVFGGMDKKFIVAGRDISIKLQSRIMTYPNMSFVNNPSDESLKELIQQAQINVLPSMNTTGVKLKLLHALFEGRFVLANSNAVSGSGLESVINIADEPENYISLIENLFQRDFIEADKKNRQQILTVYNNISNAQKLNALL
ncbi:MAG: glycosyltransferase [Flavisolibacter sp.]